MHQLGLQQQLHRWGRQQAQAAYRCRCPPGFAGASCELPGAPLPACAPPCLNGGACDLSTAMLEDAHGLMMHRGARPASGRCSCPAGFTGARCELHDPVDDCASAPCANGAACHDLQHGFHCACPPIDRMAAVPWRPPGATATVGDPVPLGPGRIVASPYPSSTLYQIH
jgi:hypothetical protein